MKIIKVIASTGLMLFICAGFLWAQEPTIQPGFKIKDGASSLKVSYDSIPTMVDWNNDGAKDLLVGQYTSGYIWLYLNQGTNLNPVFSGGTQVQSGGVPINVSYG